ncbi:hypothetical protein [Pelagerythrobacter marensis]|uniref:Uncharacterized protein n=1 Tax=Pelagerythrobacter marensis TaxID=543877 RepID=A0A0G3X952_9SPHN|nr:hypothetical protein [Pelagerythrobacter marensis]AKM07146.1 hypothetical protein AM2010_1071 [Pelagerythrobacter marensis]
MLTRLLACLALITGLAAAGTPANAAFAQAASAEISHGTVAANPGRAPRCEASVRKDRTPSRSDPVSGCRDCPSIQIYIPTVQFGPDRAFE